MSFPLTRLRRLRQNPVLRDMVTETKVTTDDLIMPLFACPGTNVKHPIKSMPGITKCPLTYLWKSVNHCWVWVSALLSSLVFPKRKTIPV